MVHLRDGGGKRGKQIAQLGDGNLPAVRQQHFAHRQNSWQSVRYTPPPGGEYQRVGVKRKGPCAIPMLNDRIRLSSARERIRSPQQRRQEG